MSARILIADDDPIQRQLLETLCHRFGYEAETAESGEAALERLHAPGGDSICLLILDLVMPDLDGMAVLARLKAAGSKIPIVVLTSQGSVESALAAVRAGAQDFVVKPAGAERLQVVIKNTLHAARLAEEVRGLSRRNLGSLTFDDLAGESAEMMRALRQGEKSAKSDIPVLLEGEPGTGKETFARAIHGASARRGRPFVAVNCAALPDLLAETVLFGGDAGEKIPGKFVEAHGGTLFLDQICELPMNAQAGLLQALQQGMVHPGRDETSGQGRCPADFCGQPQSHRTGDGRPFPRGSLLPHQCVSDLASAAPREARRHCRACRAAVRAVCRRGRETAARDLRRGACLACQL